MAVTQNPFIERDRITNPEHFAGRWSELSLLFERLEARKPVFVVGSPGIGKSSLLTHVMQSAAINLERFDLRSYYLDMAQALSAADVYRVIIEALGLRGSSLAGLQVALADRKEPVLLCLDNADAAVGAGWGEEVLDSLARLARTDMVMLVVAFNGPPPLLSERAAVIKLGAFASPEVRLFAEAYLDGTGVVFTPGELRALAELSAAHPAYLQRAAYHLFRSKLNPEIRWRAAYLEEARDKPVPGAPLPPGIFEGAEGDDTEWSSYDDEDAEPAAEKPPVFELADSGVAFVFAVPLLLGLALFAALGNMLLGLGVAIGGLLLLSALRSKLT